MLDNVDHWMRERRGILIDRLNVHPRLWSRSLNDLFRGLNGIDHVRYAEMSLCHEQAEAVDEELETEGKHGWSGRVDVWICGYQFAGVWVLSGRMA